MHKFMALSVAGVMLFSVGCTMRYSRTLDNVAPSSGRRVSASSTGLEILQIEINDTASARRHSSRTEAVEQSPVARPRVRRRASYDVSSCGRMNQPSLADSSRYRV